MAVTAFNVTLINVIYKKELIADISVGGTQYSGRDSIPG